MTGSTAVNNAINLDDFDEDEPFPLKLEFVPIDLSTAKGELLEMVLKAKKSSDTKRSFRKVLLGAFATLIVLVLALT